MVIVFAVVALMMASTYMVGQRRKATVWLAQPTSVQARLNACSAVYWALDQLRDTTLTQRKAGGPRKGDLFNSHLLAEGGTTDIDLLLPLSGAETQVAPYDSGQFGDATVSRTVAGSAVLLRAEGVCRGVREQVEAVLGSRWSRGQDTILFSADGPQPRGPDGPVRWARGTFDTSAFRSPEFDSIVQAVAEDILDTVPLFGAGATVTIMRQEDFARIPDRVMGTLIVHGTFGSLQWREHRTVTVMGDLQVGGDVTIEGVRLVVAGEVKLFDDAKLHDVSIVAGTRVYLSGQAHLTGDVLCLGFVQLMEQSRIDARSLVVASGTTKPDSGQAYTILVGEESRVDGVLIALRDPGAIHIAPEAMVTGIVWAFGKLCHQGVVQGVVAARELISCNSDTVATAYIEGAIEPLESVSGYHLPPYLGRPTVVAWHER